jgi:hypothetical protein
MKRIIRNIGSIAPLQPSAIPEFTATITGRPPFDEHGNPHVRGVCARCTSRRRFTFDAQRQEYTCPRIDRVITPGGGRTECASYDLDMPEHDRRRTIQQSFNGPAARPPNLDIVGRTSDCHTCNAAWSIDRVSPSHWRCPRIARTLASAVGIVNCSGYEHDLELYRTAPWEPD